MHLTSGWTHVMMTESVLLLNPACMAFEEVSAAGHLRWPTIRNAYLISGWFQSQACIQTYLTQNADYINFCITS